MEDEQEDASASISSSIMLLNLAPIVLLATLSVLLHACSNTSNSNNRASLFPSTNHTNDTARLSRQICLLLCCCIAHATLTIQRQTMTTTVLQDGHYDRDQQEEEGSEYIRGSTSSSSSSLRYDNSTYYDPDHPQRPEQQQDAYYVGLIVVFSYLSVVLTVLETAVRSALRTVGQKPLPPSLQSQWSSAASSHRISSTYFSRNCCSLPSRGYYNTTGAANASSSSLSPSAAMVISANRRRTRGTIRWIRAVIRPLAPASLSLVFTALYLFTVSLEQRRYTGGDDNDDDDNDDNDDNDTGSDDTSQSERNETRWWWRSITSIPRNNNEILPSLFLWFLLSYSLLFLTVYRRRAGYRSALSRLCPLFVSGTATNGTTTASTPYTFGSTERRPPRREEGDERLWYRWTAAQFLEWVRWERTKDGGPPGAEPRNTGYGGGRTASAAASDGFYDSPPYGRTHDDASDSDDDDNGGDVDRPARIHKHLAPHRIHGAVLPYLGIPDYRAMGIAYGDAVSLHVRVRELALRFPRPPDRAADGPGGPGDGPGGDGGTGGGGGRIDLEAWLRDGGRSVTGSRRPLPDGYGVPPEGEGDGSDGRSAPPIGGAGAGAGGAGAGAGAGGIAEPFGGMERVEEIMSERFGLRLPKLRTADTPVAAPGGGGHGAGPSADRIYRPLPTASELPPSSAAAAAPSVGQRQRIIDAMPANIRAIASRRPDLVSGLLLQRQQQQSPLQRQQQRSQLRPHLQVPQKTEEEDEEEEEEDAAANTLQDPYDDSDEMVGLLRKRSVTSNRSS